MDPERIKQHTVYFHRASMKVYRIFISVKIDIYLRNDI